MLSAGEFDFWRAMVPGYSWPGTVAACVVLVFLSSWYSGMETGLYRFNRLRGKLLARSGDERAVRLEELFSDQRLLIAVLLIGNNLWNYLAASVVTGYFSNSGYSEHEAEFSATAVLTPMLFVFGETLPKSLFYVRPNALMLLSRKALWISYWAVKASGIGYALWLMTTAMLRIARWLGPGGQVATDSDELTDLLRESHAEGALSSVQRGIAERIIDLPSLRPFRVMIPISRVVAFPAEVRREEFIEAVRQHSFSDFPLYDRQPANVVGLVNADALIAQPNKQPRELLEPVLRIPVNASLSQTLSTMQDQQTRTAVVVGRNDRALGMITLADVVKYLLGE